MSRIGYKVSLRLIRQVVVPNHNTSANSFFYNLLRYWRRCHAFSTVLRLRLRSLAHHLATHVAFVRAAIVSCTPSHSFCPQIPLRYTTFARCAFCLTAWQAILSQSLSHKPAHSFFFLVPVRPGFCPATAP